MTTNFQFNRCANPFRIEKHFKRKDLRKANQFVQEKLGLYGHYYLCTECRKKILVDEKQPNIDGDDDHLDDVDQKIGAENSDNGNISIKEDMDVDNDNNDQSNSGACNLSLDHASQRTEFLQSHESLSYRSETFSSQPSSESEVGIETQLPVVNNALRLLNESPIQFKKLSNHHYLQYKVDKISCNFKKLFRLDTNTESDLNINLEDFYNLIDRLKAKYNDENTSKTEKIQILTLFPSEWSERKVCEIINSSRHMVQVAKKLSETVGILAKPESKLGRSLPETVRLKILNFYNSDDVSINMPGKKDFVSMKNEDGSRTQVQKRLILSNLKELFQCYRDEYPEEKVGFSKFASLRPKNCVLAGTSGTHTICVCVIHQNIKLMMHGANLKRLTEGLVKPLTDYNDCLNFIMCQSPSSACYLGKCSDCPDTEALSGILNDVFDENDIEIITYKSWISTQRCSLETISKSSYDFIQKFCAELKVLLPHAYISTQQSNFLKSLKQNLQDEEFLIICDFAENYAFVVQNAVSGFHWNNDSATIFPVVIYFRNGDEIVHRSFVIISDCHNHDAVVVHVFLKYVTDFVKSISKNAKKIYYFSDGAPQQFKNFKNFVNLYYHNDDFGIPAEWHFFATAHGKGPCDGAGGTLKRMAARASLQLPVDEQITTPLDLYRWASNPRNLPNMRVVFSIKSEYDSANKKLISRFSKTKPITGTQKLHSIIPGKNECLIVKEFSNSTESRTCKLFKRVKK